MTDWCCLVAFGCVDGSAVVQVIRAGHHHIGRERFADVNLQSVPVCGLDAVSAMARPPFDWCWTFRDPDTVRT